MDAHRCLKIHLGIGLYYIKDATTSRRVPYLRVQDMLPLEILYATLLSTYTCDGEKALAYRAIWYQHADVREFAAERL